MWRGWHPNVTAYTIPAKFLGINGYNVIYNHAYAFLMASPLNGASSALDKQVIETYLAYKDIYFCGRYMDVRGLKVNNTNILASVIVGNDNRIGIQLYNNSENLQMVEVTLNLEDLGITKSVGDVYNTALEVHERMTDGKLTIRMDGNTICSLIITLGE